MSKGSGENVHESKFSKTANKIERRERKISLSGYAGVRANFNTDDPREEHTYAKGLHKYTFSSITLRKLEWTAKKEDKKSVFPTW